MALASGTRLGPYEIAAQIGVGGMGQVYRATDLLPSRPAHRPVTITRMSWILGLGVGGVVIAVAVWAWVSRKRNVPLDHGTISDQWRSEHRAKALDSIDR